MGAASITAIIGAIAGLVTAVTALVVAIRHVTNPNAHK